MYFVYILECADTSLYTGMTTDVERRFKEHQEGKASSYTSTRGAERIVYVEESEDRGSALRREAEIKRLSREKKLELIAEGEKKHKK